MYHRLGGCPLYQEPPSLRASSRKESPAAARPQAQVATGHQSKASDEKAKENLQGPDPQEARTPAAAQHQDRGPVAVLEAGRPYSPDDMKQESLPAKQFFERPRFDKRKYQRELMRHRRAAAKGEIATLQ